MAAELLFERADREHRAQMARDLRELADAIKARQSAVVSVSVGPEERRSCYRVTRTVTVEFAKSLPIGL